MDHSLNIKITVFIGLFALAGMPASAATIDWVNPAGGDWSEASNWNPDPATATFNDTTRFGIGDSTYTVTLDEDVTRSNGEMLVDGDDVTLDLNTSYLYTELDKAVHIGNNSSGDSRLALTNGQVYADSYYIQNDDYSGNTSSNLTVSTGALIVGEDYAGPLAPMTAGTSLIDIESGTLNVINGGEVHSNTVQATGAPLASGINVTGNGSKLINSGEIWLASSVALNISAGGIVETQDLSVQWSLPDYVADANNGIHIDGHDSRLNVSNKLTLGQGDEESYATRNVLFSVTNGAQVTVDGAVDIGDPGGNSDNDASRGGADLIIDGSEDSISSQFTHNGWMQVGGGSDSSVTVSNGGALTSNNDTYVGGQFDEADSGGHGTVTITDTGSSWTSSDGIAVGGASEGTVNILNGANASTAYMEITAGDNYASGTVNVDGTGTSLTMDELHIAEWGPSDQNFIGTGTLNVTNGGQVTINNSARLADSYSDGGDARLRVAGTNSEINIGGDLNSLEATGNVQLDVESGGLLRTDGALNLGDENSYTGATATVNVTSAGRVEADTINLGHSANDGYADITMNITNGGEVSTNELNVRDGATLDLENADVSEVGTINVEGGQLHTNGGRIESEILISGSINGPSMVDLDGYVRYVTNYGHMGVGSSPGHLETDTFSQNYGATLFMEIGGYTQGTEYDYIEAVNASLDGILEVSFLDGFNPVGNTSFEIITASNSISGEFYIDVILPTLTNGRAWDLVYTSNSVLLNVVVPIPAAVWLFASGLGMLGFWRRRKAIS